MPREVEQWERYQERQVAEVRAIAYQDRESQDVGEVQSPVTFGYRLHAFREAMNEKG